jgi:hypothetical protein
MCHVYVRFLLVTILAFRPSPRLKNEFEIRVTRWVQRVGQELPTNTEYVISPRYTYYVICTE